MSLLVPAILRVPARGDGDNCFLVDADADADADADDDADDEDGLTLVDVGWKSAPTVIRQALEAAERSLADIRRIVVTHAHPDHVRGLAEMVARTDAEVIVHELDAGWLAAGRVPSDGRSGALGRAVDRLPLLHWEPVRAMRTWLLGCVPGWSSRAGFLSCVY